MSSGGTMREEIEQAIRDYQSGELTRSASWLGASP